MNDVNSNWGFVLVGLYVFLFTNWVVGFGIMLMGFGSMYGHKYGDFEADWEGMWICFFLILGNSFGIMPLALGLLFLTITFFEDWLRKLPKVLGLRMHYVWLGIVAIAGMFGALFQVDFKTAIFSAALFGVGFYVRQNRDIPNHHAWWHVIIAAALMVRYA